MTEPDLQKLRYPIGEYSPKENITPDDIKWYINTVELFPAKIKQAVSGLSDEQLDTPYRPEGWTIRQVVHHVVDSHINSYTRFKLALTEDNPIIRPYDESVWAELPEAKTGPVELSIPLLESLHKRWVVMLKNIPALQFERKLYHPGSKMEMTIASLLQLYAWHSDHHLAHITNLKKSKAW
ncbi:MAG: YfiT family bacillithiol transferase [Ignavibacteria bacterium]